MPTIVLIPSVEMFTEQIRELRDVALTAKSSHQDRQCQEYIATFYGYVKPRSTTFNHNVLRYPSQYAAPTYLTRFSDGVGRGSGRR